MGRDRSIVNDDDCNHTTNLDSNSQTGAHPLHSLIREDGPGPCQARDPTTGTYLGWYGPVCSRTCDRQSMLAQRSFGGDETTRLGPRLSRPGPLAVVPATDPLLHPRGRGPLGDTDGPAPVRSLAVLDAGAGANHHSPGRPSTRAVPCFVDPCDLPITWPAAAYCRWVALPLPLQLHAAVGSESHPSSSSLARSIQREDEPTNAMQRQAVESEASFPA